MAANLIPGLSWYDLNARSRPALFALLPAMVVPAIWVPQVWSALGGLAALLGSCGTTFLLAQIARQRGRRLQSRNRMRLGPLQTAILLQHADDRIDRRTKQRYHDFLLGRGLAVPTADEEAADPEDALESLRAVVSWLSAATRDEKRFALLARENVAYGFRRNLAALRPIAISIAILAVCINSAALYVRWPRTDARFFAGIGLEIGLLATMAIWVAAVNLKFVEDASLGFGERLLACCDELEVDGLSTSAALGGRDQALPGQPN